MRLKSFHGPTLTEAMRNVRDALGDGAIIVATRDDEQGGVRVTAAIDETPKPVAAPVENGVLDQTGSEVIETIAKTLLAHQTAAPLAERLLAAATQFASEDPVIALAAAFDTHLRFAPLADDKAGKPLIFVGPPGAGKTLTIAKLATKAVLAKKQVNVITTDVERAGGIEQLAAFTRLLQVNLTEIEDSHALREAVLLAPPGSLVFIDTPGCNPFAEPDLKATASLIAASGGEAILVLPANIDSDEAIESAKRFQSIGAARILSTRLDMTRRLGNLIRTAFETHLPLANYGMTPKVTIPPQPFNPVSLARLLLPKDEALDVKATGTDKS
jgi:flagellar biosynthesis protein FlhF